MRIWMRRDAHYYFGHVVNYTPQERGMLLIGVSIINHENGDKEELHCYMIDTNDKKRFRSFCNNMFLYDKSGNVNFDFLIGSKVIIKSVMDKVGRYKTTFRLDTRGFQEDR